MEASKGPTMSTGSAEKIYQGLLTQIADGTLPPGASLAEGPMAEAFGVSRTPMREALQQLTRDGLAIRGHRRALIVRRRDRQELAALFEALGEVEGAIASLAAHRMSEIDRRGWANVWNRAMRVARTIWPMPRSIFGFTQRSATGPPARFWRKPWRQLELQTLPWRALNFARDTDRLDLSRTEHHGIAAAIRTRDGAEARRLMQSHVAGAFLSLTRTHPDFCNDETDTT